MAKKSSNVKGLGLMSMPVEMGSGMPRPSKMQQKEMMKREMHYRAEEDLRTLSRAQEIKNDPMRHRMVKMHAADLMKAVGKKK